MTEADRLASIQAALDAHKERCGDPVRAIRLNPWEAERLDWWDYRGIPVEADPKVPTGMVKVECLTLTVMEAIDEFHAALLEGGDEVAEAEVRLRAKLDQLASQMDDWWRLTREPDWWARLARNEPDLYVRFIRGEDLTLDDRMKAEAAQLDSPEAPDPHSSFRAWQDARADMEAEVKVPMRHRFRKWLTRRPQRGQRPTSSVRSALDRYGNSGRGR